MSGKMTLVEDRDCETEHDAVLAADEARWELAGMGYRVTQKGKRIRIYKAEVRK